MPISWRQAERSALAAGLGQAPCLEDGGVGPDQVADGVLFPVRESQMDRGAEKGTAARQCQGWALLSVGPSGGRAPCTQQTSMQEVGLSTPLGLGGSINLVVGSGLVGSTSIRPMKQTHAHTPIGLLHSAQQRIVAKMHI